MINKGRGFRVRGLWLGFEVYRVHSFTGFNGLTGFLGFGV